MLGRLVQQTDRDVIALVRAPGDGAALASDASRRGSLGRFVHVSAAYVAGDRSDRISEYEGDVGQGFRNTYGRTKPKAEHAVHDSGLPAAIVRPSIVVGDSASGSTRRSTSSTGRCRRFARGLFPTVPADPAAHVDIVPVDVVADTLVELLRGPMRTGTFHVVSGDNGPTAGALARDGQWGKQALPRWSAERQALQHVA